MIFIHTRLLKMLSLLLGYVLSIEKLVQRDGASPVYIDSGTLTHQMAKSRYPIGVGSFCSNDDHLTVIHTGSPRALASTISSLRRFRQKRELSTMPGFRFSPTRMQPSVSLAVLPA